MANETVDGAARGALRGLDEAKRLPVPDLSGVRVADEHLRRALLGLDYLVIDGAMGTQMQERGLAEAGELPELLNFSHPDDITAIHAMH